MMQWIIGGSSFLIGVIVGWVIRGRVDEKQDPTRHICAIIVILVWVASVAYDMLSTTYATPWAVHALTGAVFGWLFGFNPFKGLIGKNGKKPNG